MELCQREVHLFLRDYFAQFNNTNIEAWCAKHKVRSFVIPKDYRELANRYERAKILGQHSLQAPNLALIPSDPARVLLTEKPDAPGDIWGVNIVYYVDGNVPNFPDKTVEEFGNMKENVRCQIGTALSSCVMMLKQLQVSHPELKNLELELDKEKMAWYLKDKILGNKFGGRLGVSFKLLLPDEVDKEQTKIDAFRRVR